MTPAVILTIDWKYPTKRELQRCGLCTAPEGDPDTAWFAAGPTSGICSECARSIVAYAEHLMEQRRSTISVARGDSPDPDPRLIEKYEIIRTFEIADKDFAKADEAALKSQRDGKPAYEVAHAYILAAQKRGWVFVKKSKASINQDIARSFPTI